MLERSAEAGQAPPREVEAHCPSCGETGTHNVVKARGTAKAGAVDGTFTCRSCGHTHQGRLEIPVPREVPFNVSDEEGRTRPLSVAIVSTETVHVGDEFEVGEALVEVTSVETDDGKRVRRAKADRVGTLWGKDVTQVTVPFAMNVGSTTRSFEAQFGPDDSIGVADVFDLDGEEVEVKQVVTREGRRRHGRHNVREIRRVWLKRTRPEHGRPPPGRSRAASGGRTGRRPQGGGRAAGPRRGRR